MNTFFSMKLQFSKTVVDQASSPTLMQILTPGQVRFVVGGDGNLPKGGQNDGLIQAVPKAN